MGGNLSHCQWTKAKLPNVPASGLGFRVNGLALGIGFRVSLVLGKCFVLGSGFGFTVKGLALDLGLGFYCLVLGLFLFFGFS